MKKQFIKLLCLIAISMAFSACGSGGGGGSSSDDSGTLGKDLPKSVSVTK